MVVGVEPEGLIGVAVGKLDGDDEGVAGGALDRERQVVARLFRERIQRLDIGLDLLVQTVEQVVRASVSVGPELGGGMGLRRC